MAVLTPAAFFSKWSSLFPSDGLRSINGARMREFTEDVKDSFFSVFGGPIETAWKDPVEVATTGNIVLSGEQTIDDVLTSSSRVLVRSQSTASENGIYVSAAGVWGRATDADTAGELEGAAVGVQLGTSYGNTVWLQTADSITIGVTSITWQQIGFGVSSQDLSQVLTQGNDGGGLNIENIADPVNAQDAATKAYVDSAPSGISGLTTNRIPYATSATTIGDDSGLTWNPTNNAMTVGVNRLCDGGSGNNTFLGPGAGVLASTGSENVIIGLNAGNGITSADGNNLIGFGAGGAITTGDYNVVVGHNALVNLTTGSHNITLGRFGLQQVTGDGNIGIGFSAGDQITSGSRNIVIGYNNDAQSATASDQLTIQNIIIGTNNGGTGTTVSTGEIGIGVVPTTGEKFHVRQNTGGNAVLKYSSNTTNDDAQITIYQNRVATTNATVTTLHTYATTTDNVHTLEALVIARRTGGAAGAAGDSASYKIIGTFKNIAGTVTQIGATSVVHSVEDQAGWDCVFDISTTNVRVRVTGAVDNNVTWHLSELKATLVGT